MRSYCFAAEVNFNLLTIQKIKIFKKWKKTLVISSFYTRVPKIIILCYTVPETWRMTDVIFHFGLFFALLPPSNNLETQKFEKMKKKTWEYHYFTHVHHKSWSYALMFLRYGTWRLQFSLFFLGYFLPFQQPNNPENQNFEKMK